MIHVKITDDAILTFDGLCNFRNLLQRAGLELQTTVIVLSGTQETIMRKDVTNLPKGLQFQVVKTEDEVVEEEKVKNDALIELQAVCIIQDASDVVTK